MRMRLSVSPLDHSPLSPPLPGGKKAVLLIHGIVGSPAHFRHLLPAIPEDWSVCSLLLDGHGGSVEGFSRSSMKTWKAQVSRAVEQLLEEYDQLVLVAHSMGCLFAIREALQHPEIDRLFLLAVPTRPRPRFSTVCSSLRLLWGKHPPTAPGARAMWLDTALQLDRRLWKYLGWIPRYLELLSEIRQTRRLLPELHTPSLVFQSERDELVSCRTWRDLEKIPCLRLQLLAHSGHFQYGEEDLSLLQQELWNLLKE